MEHKRTYYQVPGGLSVTSDVPEVVELLGSCAEPMPTGLPVAVLSGEHEGLPAGALVFRYPSQGGLASDHIGIELPATERDGSPVVVSGPEPPAAFSITATQLRLWLFRRGVSESQVAAAIESIPDDNARGEAAIQWRHAPYFERTHPLVEAVAASLGMSQSDLAEAFTEASYFG